MMEIYEEIVALSPELVRISQKAVDYAERLVNGQRNI
jgi:hypothetical protein